MSSDLVLKGAALLLLFLGAAIDLRSRRIPNLITFGGAFAGVVANLVVHQQQGLWLSVGGWVVGVLLLAIPFALGGMGAGDVKLLAMAGAWGGPLFAVYTVLFGAIVGGVAALGVLVASGELGSRVAALLAGLRWRLALALGMIWPRALALVSAGSGSVDVDLRTPRHRLTFPYGPALAIGALIAVVLR